MKEARGYDGPDRPESVDGAAGPLVEGHRAVHKEATVAEAGHGHARAGLDAPEPLGASGDPEVGGKGIQHGLVGSMLALLGCASRSP